MSWNTISVGRVTYALLRAAKRAGGVLRRRHTPVVGPRRAIFQRLQVSV